MIKLTVFVQRNPALSIDEFHAEWRAHGQMIADEPAFRTHIRRYEQHHRTLEDYRKPLLGDGPDRAQYDGVAVQWFDSFKDFLALIQTPEYAAKMQPDEARILDPDGIVVLFTEEAEVFIP